MIILLDQDDVLADYNGGFLKLWRARYPNEFYVPLYQRKSFDATFDYPANLKDKMRSIYLAPGFVRGLPPMDGAIRAVRYLVSCGHDVRICTAPLTKYENCVLEKYQWVEIHLGREFTRKLILTKDKTLVRSDLLIDDKPEILGAVDPTWEHVLFEQSYNRQVVGKRRINWYNYRSILDL